MAARAHYHNAGYSKWIRVLQNLPLDATTKVVGYALALSADFDTGQHAHPGITRLMQHTGLRSDRSVRDALGKLERLGLIHRNFKGSSTGRRGWADEYWLTLHDEARLMAGKEPCDCDTRADPWAA